MIETRRNREENQKKKTRRDDSSKKEMYSKIRESGWKCHWIPVLLSKSMSIKRCNIWQLPMGPFVAFVVHTRPFWLYYSTGHFVKTKLNNQSSKLLCVTFNQYYKLLILNKMRKKFFFSGIMKENISKSFCLVKSIEQVVVKKQKISERRTYSLVSWGMKYIQLPKRTE